MIYMFVLYITGDHYCSVIGLLSRVFANGPRDWGSIPGTSHTKDSKNGT